MSVEWVPLARHLVQRRDPDPVLPGTSYPIAGVLGFGRGILRRPPIDGSETSYKQFTRLAENDVVYSKVKAFEGAVAVVTAADSGRYVSPEFPVFTVDGDIDPSYLRHVLTWEFFLDELKSLSAGIGARRERVHPKQLLNLRIPLPPIDEQRRIAAHLDSLSVTDSEKLGERSALVEVLRNRGWGGHRIPVGQLVERVVRRVPVEDEVTYPMQGVRWYGGGAFCRESPVGRDLSAKVVYEVRSGDLIYNRLFAWKQSFAIAQADHEGYVSNEFPTYRVDESQVLPEFLLGQLLSDSFTQRVNDASTGSTPTSRNRLKVDAFESLTVDIPDIAVQQRVVDADRLARSIARLDARRRRLSDALVPAARNEIFSAMR